MFKYNNQLIIIILQKTQTYLIEMKLLHLSHSPAIYVPIFIWHLPLQTDCALFKMSNSPVTPCIYWFSWWISDILHYKTGRIEYISITGEKRSLVDWFVIFSPSFSVHRTGDFGKKNYRKIRERVSYIIIYV